MQEPLLKVAGSGKRDCSSIQRFGAAAGCQALLGWHMALRRLLWRWWSTTSDQRCLESEIHFRHRWPWLLPMGALLL
eukprot:720236-Amphidinium_carterae.1